MINLKFQNCFLLAMLVFFLGLSGCNSKKSSYSYLDESVELMAIDIFAPPPYRAARTRSIDIIHTQLHVSFDWEKQYMHGEATIHLKPYFYALNTVVLDAKGQEINKVMLVNEGVKTPLEYSYNGAQLQIDLGRSYEKSEELILYIDYIAKPEERNMHSGMAITSDKGLYFINPLGLDTNKPQQIWTQGETEANSVWFPTIDAPNERCTHQISMTVEDRFVTLSNGVMTDSYKNEDGTRTDVWVQNQPIAPYLFMMAVSEFAVVQDSLHAMEVNYYVDSAYAPYAKEIFKNTPEMIQFYSDVLAYPYPWNKYAQVVVHDYVSGAMENVGAVVFGDFMQQTHQEMIDGDNEIIVAHELFHHWFGDLVTCESWANLPLNESFATYGEYLWLEYKYGSFVADAHLHGELRSYLYEVKNGSAENMIRFHYRQPDDMFDSHSYAKGGTILHMLRNHVGDEAFFSALNLYLKENAFSAVEIHQLRLAFEKVTGEDLNWFFNQWFMGKGHPELIITYAYNTEQQMQYVTVLQEQDRANYGLFTFPVDIDIYVGGNKTTYPVMVDSATQTFSFKVDTKPDLVNFDAKKILVCTKLENHTDQEMQFMYDHAPKFMDKREAVMYAVKDCAQSDWSSQLLLEAMTHPNPSIRKIAVSNYPGREKGSPEFKNTLLNLVTNDANSSLRLKAVMALSEFYGSDEQVQAAFNNQVKKDSSLMVLGELLISITQFDSDNGLQLAKRFENSDNLDILFSVAYVYAQHGEAVDSSFFTRLYLKVTGYEVMEFIDFYQEYLLRLDQIQPQQTGVDILIEQAENQLGWYVRYYAVSALVDLKAYYLLQVDEKKSNKESDLAQQFEDLIQQIDSALKAIRLTETDNRVFMKR